MNIARLSIRTRITGGSLLIAILISIVAGIVIYSQVARIVSDGQIRVLEGIEGQYVTAITTGDTEEFDMPGPGQFVAVVNPAGAVMIDTFSESAAGTAQKLAAQPDGTRRVDGATEYIARSTSVETAEGTWHVVTASVGDSQVLAEVAWLLIASIAGINLAFGASAWLIGSAALSPVARLRRSAAELAAEPGTELLPVGPARDEISDLAETLNELIAQLRRSAERERQIVSDASHEFRTPLAIIQTRLELAQREALDPVEMKAEVAAAQRTLSRLSSLATSMLELSRIDAQRSGGTATVEALSTELADAVDRWRRRVASSSIRIDFDAEISEPNATVSVTVEDFGRICDNLIGNSVQAIGDGGVVELRLGDSDVDSVVLSVIDDGGGMDSGFVASAMDRFSRQSAARTGGGAGLGLPIVAGIVANAGGTVTLVNSPGEGLRVDLRLSTA